MKHHISFDLELRKNPYQGLYIAIEGIDGSGKTTQVEKVAEYLESKGLPAGRQGKTVVRTREPRNEGVVGSLIRKILRGELKVPPVSLQYLYSADRAIHHEEVIIPTLKQEGVIVSDRCFWSAIPYGILDRVGEAYDVSESDMLLVSQGILSMYHQFIVPDLTFYLRASVDVAMKRIGEKKEKIELYEEREKLEKIIAGYEWLVGQFPKEITVIDGERPVEEVTKEIIKKLT